MHLMSQHRFFLNLALFLATVTAAFPADPQPLTDAERTRAKQELNATRQRLADATANLSDAQWTFRSAPERWTIAEVMEHLAITENAILGLVRSQLLQSPLDPTVNQNRDSRILTGLADRTNKFQAPEIVRPASKFPTGKAAAAAFAEGRKATIAYAESTADPLRAHSLAHPAFGPIDGYQWLLFLSGHSDRHRLQIEEIKADPKFPAK